MVKFLIRSAAGEWDCELQEWVDYGDGSRFENDEDAYDVASQLTGRALRIEDTNGTISVRINK